MQDIYETYDAARLACDEANSEGRSRTLSVYRVYTEDDRHRFVVALSPAEALGKVATFFGLRVERWPRRSRQKESPRSLLDSMTDEQIRQFIDEVEDHLRQRKRRKPGEESP